MHSERATDINQVLALLVVQLEALANLERAENLAADDRNDVGVQNVPGQDSSQSATQMDQAHVSKCA